MKKLLLITTALVAAADPAHAGPVAAAVAWVGSTVGGIMAAGGIGAAAMQFAIGMGLNAIAGALLKPKGFGGANVSFDVQMGDDLPLSFIVGDYATAGRRKYIGSWGTNTRFITEVIEVSGLPQGLAGLWVNDEPGEFVAGRRGHVPASASPSSVGRVTEGASVPGGALDIGTPLENNRDNADSTDPRIWVKWIDGSQTAADPFLVWAFGGDPDYPWTAGMVGRGKSYAVVTCQYDHDTQTSYPTFLLEPAPLRLYDLRQDSTAGGSGAQRWNNPATWQPTLNAAVIAYNVARGIYYGDEWVYGGRNLPAWRLPAADWMAAANACDDPVGLSGGGIEPRYRAGLEIRVDVPAADVLEELGRAANMRFAEVGGRLKPTVDLPGAAVFSFTDGDVLITEGQSFQPFYPISETFNAISATYPEPREKWATKDAPEYIDTAAMAEDGQYLPTSIAYGAVPFPRQVRRLERSQMRDFRRMRRHQFHLPPDAYALEPNDLVSWTSARNGYSHKLFVVESVTRLPGMCVLVSLREVDPGDYDWSSSWEVPVVITAPKNPRPYVQNVPGLTFTAASIRDGAGQPRRPAILATCDDDQAGVTHIQIQARVTGDEITIDTSRPYTAPHRWHLRDVLPDTDYQCRARLISNLTPKTPWSTWMSVKTFAISFGIADMTEDLIEGMKDTARAAGVTPVETLPASGEPNQIVMLVPDGILYRWDPVAGAWTTKLYAGIPDGALSITKFADGIEPVGIIDDAAPLPTTKTTKTIFWQGKLYRWSGSAYIASVPATDIAGQITAPQIADAAVLAAKIAGGAVTAIKLATDAVTRDKIIAGAIDSARLADGAATAAKIAASAITETKLAADAVTRDKIVAGAIDSARLADGAATAAKIATSAITATKIENGAVSTPKLAAAAVEAGKIAAGAIIAGALAAGSVEAGKIAAGAVTAEKISAGAVGADQIAANAVTAVKVAANAITAGKIEAGAVTAGALAAGSVEAGKIAAGAVTAEKIAAGAVGADQIAANAILSSKLAVGDFRNLVPDGDLADAAIWNQPGWTRSNTTWGGAESPNVLRREGGDVYNLGKPFPVRPGQEYHLSFQAARMGSTGVYRAWGQVEWLNQSGEGIDFSPPVNTGIVSDGTMRKYTGAITGPGGVATARWRWAVVAAETTSDGVYFWAPTVLAKNTGELIVDGAITTAKLDAQAVNADKLAANAVTAVKIAASAITTVKLAAGAVTADEIAANAITTGKIAAAAVSATQIAANAITSAKLASNSVTADAIAAGSVTTDGLAAGAVVASKIAAGAVTAAKISVDSLSAISANLGTIQVGSANIANAAITAAKIGELEVKRINIDNGSVSVTEAAYTAGLIDIASSTVVQTLTYTSGRAGRQILDVHVNVVISNVSLQLRLVADGSTVNKTMAVTDHGPQTFRFVDTVSRSASTTYEIVMFCNTGTARVSQRLIQTVNNYK